jgi:hypothetical protein
MFFVERDHNGDGLQGLPGKGCREAVLVSRLLVTNRKMAGDARSHVISFTTIFIDNFVATMFNTELSQGVYATVLNVERLPAGVYYCVLETGGHRFVQPLHVAR